MLGRPLFLVAGWWHPVTLLLRLLRLGDVASTTPYAIALLTFGLVTSIVAIRRGRFLVTALVLTLTIIGTNWFFFEIFLIALTIAVLLFARGAQRLFETIAALIVAALLAAPWLLPAYLVGRERASATSFDSQLFERIRTYPVARQPKITCFLPDAALVGGTPDALARLTNLRELAVVDHVPEKITNLSGGALKSLPGQRFIVHNSGGDATVRRAGRELAVADSDLSIDVNSRGWNLLVTNVEWWDGWRVYVNNDRYPPNVVNTAFVGTWVPPGHSNVVFRYQPTSVQTGLRFTLLGIVLLVVFARVPFAKFAERVPKWQLPRVALPHIPLPSIRLRYVAIPLFVIYAIVLIVHRVEVAGGADSSGYLNQSRQWIARQLRAPLPLADRLGLSTQSEVIVIPLGYTHATQPRHMVPTYPAGLPLQMALMRIIGGERGAFLVTPLMAILGLLAMYRLLRDLGFTSWWSFGGASMLAVCPIWIYHGIQPMSDVVAGFWAIGAMLCAFRGARDPRFAALAGVCMGIGVLTRPTQVLLFPAIACAIGLFNRRSLIALALGGAPFALAQMAISKYLYGSPFVTGYGSVFAELRWSYFLPRFLHYSFWLAAILTPLGFPIGFLGLTRRDVERRIRITLAVWFVPFFLFYCFYEPYDTWWYTRFLVPAIPSLIIAALFLITRMPRPIAGGVMIAVLAFQLGVAWHFEVLTFGEGEELYPRAAQIVAARVPRDAVVVAMQHSGSLYYYDGRQTLNYIMLDRDMFEAIRAKAHLFALVSDWELPTFHERTTDRAWTAVARLRDVTLYELR